MKRTDLERMERELRRKQKKDRILERRASDSDSKGVKAYTDNLFALLQHDEIQIYNADDDEDILALLLEMREDLPEKEWGSVVKKAVRLTKVTESDAAISSLLALLKD